MRKISLFYVLFWSPYVVYPCSGMGKGLLLITIESLLP